MLQLEWRVPAVPYPASSGDDVNPIRNGLSACVVAAITVYALVPGNSHAQAPAQDPIQFFETKVRPLLAEHCYSCHSVDAKKVQAGLWSTTAAV